MKCQIEWARTVRAVAPLYLLSNKGSVIAAE